MTKYQVTGFSLLSLTALVVAAKLLFGWVGGVEILRTSGATPYAMVPATGVSFLLAQAAVLLTAMGKARAAVAFTLTLAILVTAVTTLQAVGMKQAAGLFLAEVEPSQYTAAATCASFLLLAIVLLGLNDAAAQNEFLREVALVTGMILTLTALAVNIYDPAHQQMQFLRGMSDATALLMLGTYAAVIALFYPPHPRDREAF